MPKYLINRELPGAGSLTPEELHGVATKSNQVLADLAPDVQWVQSYVTADGITCVYNAASEELIREHARRGGFPCDGIQQVSAVMDPVTGEG